MKLIKSAALVFLAVFTVLAYIPAPLAQAQTSSALSIAPRKEYVVEPGETREDKFSIRNIDSNRDLNLSMKVIDFTYTDDSGTPKLNLDEDVDPTAWSLRPYMEIPESASIKAGSSDTFDIKINIPKNLGGGSYYSAIFYSTSAPDGGNVGLSASGVTLVFVNVPGKVDENLNLKKFGAYNRVARKYMFATMKEPQVIAYTLENKGNVTEAPVGSIKLKDMFGHEYSINDINPSKSRALIGQTRTFQSCIKLKSEDVNFKGDTAEANTCTAPGLWPGFYTASIDMYFGQNGNNTQEITKSAIFWYLPLWFLIALLIILLVIAYFVWRLTVVFKGGSFHLGDGPKRSKRPSSRRR